MKAFFQSRRFFIATIAILSLWFSVSSLSLSKANLSSSPCPQPDVTRIIVPTNTPSDIVRTPAPKANYSPCQTPTPVGKSRTLSGDHLSSLVAKAQVTGKLPVIVQLNVPSTPEGLLNTRQMALQRTSIQSAKTVLVNTLKPFNVRSLATHWHAPYVALELSPQAIQYLASSPQVVSIRESRRLKLLDTASNDVIDTPEAWSVGYDGAGQTVAILDTGVQNDHPFLVGKVVAEACFSSSNYCPDSSRMQIGSGSAAPCTGIGCEHGTHVAGIAAGLGGGSTGVTYSGVAKSANIIAVQVFSRDATTNDLFAWDIDIISGLNYIYELRHNYNIAAINLSMGFNDGQFNTQFDCDNADPATKFIIDQLRSVGISTIAGAGNDSSSSNMSAPGCLSSVIGVGATNNSDVVAGISNSNTMLDLWAPGIGIESSIPSSSYGILSGTSMSTAHVVGAWAVMKHKSPLASVSQILSTFQNTGVSITDARNGVAKARIDLDAAVAALPAMTCDTSSVIKRVSVPTDPNPDENNTGGINAAISANGRFIVFESFANIVPDNRPSTSINISDIFLHDRITCQTTLVGNLLYSDNVISEAANGHSSQASISADGRYVAFASLASNLLSVPPMPAVDTNGYWDIFVYDQISSTIERVSVSSTGIESNNQSFNPSISADGRFVVFQSDASNLVAGDTNAKTDVFMHDRSTGQTILVSKVGTKPGNNASINPVISSDGSSIVFASQASNLVVGDTNAKKDIFLYNRSANTISLISRAAGATGVLSNGDSDRPSITAMGHYIAFESTASNLVVGDTNAKSDIFLRDTIRNGTLRISVSNNGNIQGDGDSIQASISGNGLYTIFQSVATNLVTGDTNSLPDVFIRNFKSRQTIRISVSDLGIQTNSMSDMAPMLAQDATFFAFQSSATDLISGNVETSSDFDIFVGSFTFPPTATRQVPLTRIPPGTPRIPRAPTQTHTPTPSQTPTPG